MARRTFRHPRTKRVILDRNFSERSSVGISQIAVHTTESHPRPGVSDVLSIYRFFNTPGTDASSHFVLQAPDLWQIVPDEKKAWTIGAANSWTLNIEIIGFAATSTKAWLSGANLRSLRLTAKLIAYLSKKHDIPIHKGSLAVSGGVLRPGRAGVIRHADVSKAGFGTHTDPGRGFPLTLVLRWARWYAKHGWVA